MAVGPRKGTRDGVGHWALGPWFAGQAKEDGRKQGSMDGERVGKQAH